MQFFTTEPHACDPSSLPKYPPSKELDVKLREEEARRFEFLDFHSQSSGLIGQKLICIYHSQAKRFKWKS